MRRFRHPICLSALAFLVIGALPLAADSYRIVQITTSAADLTLDHRWPSINNRGDIVWSQKVNGNWQVFKRSGPATSTSIGANILPPDGPNHNYKYPAISDIGDI